MIAVKLNHMGQVNRRLLGMPCIQGAVNLNKIITGNCIPGAIELVERGLVKPFRHHQRTYIKLDMKRFALENMARSQINAIRLKKVAVPSRNAPKPPHPTPPHQTQMLTHEDTLTQIAHKAD